MNGQKTTLLSTSSHLTPRIVVAAASVKNAVAVGRMSNSSFQFVSGKVISATMPSEMGSGGDFSGMYIGYSENSADYYDGDIDDVQTFDGQAYTQSQVTNLYAQGRQ